MSRIGWRWWDLEKDGALRSVNGEIWPPNEAIHAECIWHEKNLAASMKRFARDNDLGKHSKVVHGKVVNDPVPAYNCSCGIWAYYDPEIASGLPHVSGYLARTRVFGAIEAWGGIVEHELGFRCEWAIPRGVWVIRGHLHPAYEVTRFKNLDELTKVWDYEDQHG